MKIAQKYLMSFDIPEKYRETAGLLYSWSGDYNTFYNSLQNMNKNVLTEEIYELVKPSYAKSVSEKLRQLFFQRFAVVVLDHRLSFFDEGILSYYSKDSKNIRVEKDGVRYEYKIKKDLTNNLVFTYSLNFNTGHIVFNVFTDKGYVACPITPEFQI